MGDREIELTDEQRAVVTEVLRGSNVLITGAAGVGKSVVTDAIEEAMPGVEKTGTTGVAAVNIGGRTIYSWAGIGLGKKTIDDYVASLRKQYNFSKKSGKLDSAGYRVVTTDTLIIDEISMLPHRIFDKLDKIFRRVRGKLDTPFGGMQLVLCGDFFQLPPVQKDVATCNICGAKAKSVGNGVYECSVKGDPRCKTKRWDNKLRFCFDSDIDGRNLWDLCNFKVCELTRVHRQDNSSFIEILHRIRRGTHKSTDIEFLMKRCGHNTIDVSDGVKPTILYTHNVDVDAKNEIEYEKLDGETEVRYTAAKSCVNPSGGTMVRNSKLLELLCDHAPGREIQKLKVGAQVMLVANINVPLGLCNGTRGVVVGFSDHVEGVQSVRVHRGLLKPLPRVRFMLKNGEHMECDVLPYAWENKTHNEHATFIQIPLILGWATTIHKSQGMSLTKVEMSLESAFADGQVYVALSRATGLDGHLYIKSLNPKKIKTNAKVKEFYDGGRKRAADDSDDDWFDEPKRAKPGE